VKIDGITLKSWLMNLSHFDYGTGNASFDLGPIHTFNHGSRSLGTFGEIGIRTKE